MNTERAADILRRIDAVGFVNSGTQPDGTEIGKASLLALGRLIDIEQIEAASPRTWRATHRVIGI